MIRYVIRRVVRYVVRSRPTRRATAVLGVVIVVLVGVSAAACEPERTRAPGEEPPQVATAPAGPAARGSGHDPASDALGGDAGRAPVGATADESPDASANGEAAGIALENQEVVSARLGDDEADWDLVHGPVATAMASLTATLTAEPPTGDDAMLDAAGRAALLGEADTLRSLGYHEEAEQAYLTLLGGPRPEGVDAAVALARTALRDDDPAAALALLSYAAPDGLEALPPVGQYHYGDAAERLYEYPAAAAAYNRYGEAVPDMADVANLAAGTAYYSAGRYPEALEALTAARDLAGDESTAYLAALRRGNTLLRIGPPSEASAAYDEAFDLATNDFDRANALAGKIAAQLEAGEDSAAAETRRRLVRDLPASSLAATALERLESAGVAVPANERAAVLAGSGDYMAAVAAYEEAISGQASAPAAWHMAVMEAYRSADDHSAAIAAADRLMAESPEDPLAAEAAWWRGRSLQQTGAYREAADSFAALAMTWPSHERAAEALWRRAAIVDDLDGKQPAADAYDDLAQRYPDDGQAQEARFKSVFLRLFGGYVTAAEERLASLAADGDDEARARAHYWLGRIALDKGENGAAATHWHEAVAADSADYYGLLAAERLGGGRQPNTGQSADPEGDVAVWLAAWQSGFDETVWSSVRERVARRRDVGRAAAWLALGERRAAVRTMDNAVRALADDPAALAAIAFEAHEMGLHGGSIAAALRALGAAPDGHRDAAPAALWRLAYPDAFGTLVREAAAERGVPAALLFALIRSESRFEPSAQSSVGALGLTQVMPTTGQSIAGWLGEESFDPASLHRPETAVRFGAWYLGQQLEQNEWRVPLALAAYNGGPGNAHRWWDDARGDIDRVAEVIDYSETRKYVRWVTEAQARYEQLYGDLGP